MIICNLHGGFGNHLLCYFLGCILADKFKKQIYINGNEIINDVLLQRKDTRETIYKVINPEYISYTKLNKNMININTIEDYYSYLNKTQLDECYININIIWMNLSFYNNYLNILNKYIININNDNKNENSIVISLRLGMGINEVAQPSPFETELRLPFEYYKKAIDNFLNNHKNIKKLIICSDNFSDKYIDNFKIYNVLDVEFCDKNTLEQFKYITNADFFISSNSTFSLLGALLNTTGMTTIPNFKESNAVYPGKINSRYSDILNINTANCIKILL